MGVAVSEVSLEIHQMEQKELPISPQIPIVVFNN
jgi:hypothetical protein